MFQIKLPAPQPPGQGYQKYFSKQKIDDQCYTNGHRNAPKGFYLQPFHQDQEHNKGKNQKADGFGQKNIADNRSEHEKDVEQTCECKGTRIEFRQLFTLPDTLNDETGSAKYK